MNVYKDPGETNEETRFLIKCTILEKISFGLGLEELIKAFAAKKLLRGLPPNEEGLLTLFMHMQHQLAYPEIVHPKKEEKDGVKSTGG